MIHHVRTKFELSHVVENWGTSDRIVSLIITIISIL